MQIYARDHVEVHPQKEKEVLYLVKKRQKKNNGKKHWKVFFLFGLEYCTLKSLEHFFFNSVRWGGSWYFRPSSREGLANFTSITGMGHLICEPRFKIPTPPPPANFWQVPYGWNCWFLDATVLGCIAAEKQGGSWEAKSQGRKKGKPFVQTELFFSPRAKW